jgi:hypothetical protein
MKKLGEQWIETIDGEQHMVKAIPITSGYVCHGCMFYDANIQDCSKYTIPCDDKKFIIKDLGTVNGEGLLACPFCGEFPHIETFLGMEGIEESRVWCVICTGEVFARTMLYNTEQEAIDAWNRRHA